MKPPLANTGMAAVKLRHAAQLFAGHRSSERDPLDREGQRLNRALLRAAREYAIAALEMRVSAAIEEAKTHAATASSGGDNRYWHGRGDGIESVLEYLAETDESAARTLRDLNRRGYA